MNNKISIITVTFNCDKVIEDTIKSVLSQKYDEYEYIIIDGKSSDKTLDVIYKYQNLISHIITEPDKGIFDAMNKGIKIASGDWIIFMNAGDLFLNDNVLSDIFKQNLSMFDVIYGKTAYIADGKFFSYCSIPFFERSRRYKGMGICHQSILVKVKTARKLLFDISFKVVADYDMINKIYKSGGAFYEYNGFISAIDTNGYSVKNRNAQRKEIMLICKVKPNIALSLKFAFIDCMTYIRSVVKKIIKRYAPSFMDNFRVIKSGTRIIK